MPRPNPSAFTGELGPDTRTFWAVEIGFPTPLRLCTREPMTIGGDTFVHAGLEIDLDTAAISIFNEDQAFTPTFHGQDTARVPVKVWQGYGVGGTWAYTDLRLEIEGLMGGGVVGVEIGFQVRREKPRQTPGLVIGDVISDAHLIPDGAIANTPSGKVKLTST